MLVKCIAAYTHLSSTVYELSEILVGNCNFSLSLAFNAPRWGCSIGILGKCLVLRKLESWVTRQWRQFDDRLSRFDTIPACDRQTDRWTDVRLYQERAQYDWRTLKTRPMGYVRLKPTDNLFSRFDTVHECDRRKNRLTDVDRPNCSSIYTALCIAACGKNTTAFRR